MSHGHQNLVAGGGGLALFLLIDRLMSGWGVDSWLRISRERAGAEG
jgi:hypothetical protein